MEKHKKKIYFLFLCICMVFFSSCGKEEPKKAAHQGTPRDHTPLRADTRGSRNYGHTGRKCDSGCV